MKAGLQFESMLKRGLLEYAFQLPDHSPEFRYAYHEVIEEAQHSLMFQEFVNRTGLDVPGLTWDLKFGARRVIGIARRFPALFFVFVLGGEDPIDHVQRTALRSERELHPLLERIMRIHVTEEARHLSFARQYLRTNVPTLSRRRRHAIAIEAPLILAQMASVMMRPPRSSVREYDIPKDVLVEAYGPALAVARRRANRCGRCATSSPSSVSSPGRPNGCGRPSASGKSPNLPLFSFRAPGEGGGLAGGGGGARWGAGPGSPSGGRGAPPGAIPPRRLRRFGSFVSPPGPPVLGAEGSQTPPR